MLDSIDAALVDLDGTVYRGAEPLPGAARAVERLRADGVDVLFVSNNPTRDRDAAATKLAGMDIPARPDEVLTSSRVTARHLATEEPGRHVLVIGERVLLDELEAAGVPVTEDPERAEILLASLDRNFDYQTLTLALQALDSGTSFLATNLDRTWPVADGEIPDARGMIGAIEGVTGRQVDLVMGKPSTTMTDFVLRRLEASPERCLVVGDRLETDVEMGLRAGMVTGLVLTGATGRDELEAADEGPDHVFKSMAELARTL